VFGEGDPTADIMFIGEGPGATEDQEGRPFVGLAGKILENDYLPIFKVGRGEIYICNTVKCRPPDNRVPMIDELQACRPFWQEQVHIIQPRLIITLGATASKEVLGRFQRGVRGYYGYIPVMPTWHPAYILRDRSKLSLVQKDLQYALILLNKLRRKSHGVV
jgi:DNA polymerase